MPSFDIFTESFLGLSHSGEVTADGSGTIELTDEEVQQLIDLIRENGGETDVEKLELEEKYPEIYETLDEAYRDAAMEAEYDHWVIEGYENGWYDVPCEEIIEKCEQKYGFKFEYDPKDFIPEGGTEVDEYSLFDAKMDALNKWIEEYRSQHYDQEIGFLSDVFGLEPEIDDVDYIVEIPPAIIEMAKGKQ